MDSYTPDILEGKYTRFLLDLQKCPECGGFMVAGPRGGRDIFPRYYKLTFAAQARAAEFGIVSDLRSGNHPICQDCANAGKAWFHCELCKEKKSADKVKESFGDPPEFLCVDCYETVLAKEWDGMVDKLRRYHRWDSR